MTESLASALATFQASLPHVGKDNLAVVKSDKGNYKYTYADLADVSRVVLPALARQGLSFSTKPTMVDGKFVLEYTLRHTGGESDTGYYPLPTSGTPQQVGSAVTYARRYTLSAITGVVADEDDDGQAAQQAATAPRQHQEPPQVVDAGQARGLLAATCDENGWDRHRVAVRYGLEHGGPLGDATDATVIERFRKSLFNVPDADLKAPATNGAAQ